MLSEISPQLEGIIRLFRSLPTTDRMESVAACCIVVSRSGKMLKIIEEKMLSSTMLLNLFSKEELETMAKELIELGIQIARFNKKTADLLGEKIKALEKKKKEGETQQSSAPITVA